jgi:hypothetical protein
LGRQGCSGSGCAAVPFCVLAGPMHTAQHCACTAALTN